MIPWLLEDAPFPPPTEALTEPNGLLCAGGDLSPQRLLAAYRQGIFPWFGPDEPILWWTPDPRMVVFPDEFTPTRSLARILRHGGFTVRYDSAFAEVIDACASIPRPGQRGTWITPAIRRAYLRLHELGWAHSVEVWSADAELIGGLYGLAIGRVFYGESMFSRRSNASKIAFAHLVALLRQRGFALIDCQVRTAHLASLGGREISRASFGELLTRLTAGAHPERWPSCDAAALAPRKETPCQE